MPKQAIVDALTISAQMSADDAQTGNIYINGPIVAYAMPEYFNETGAFSVRKALKAVDGASTLNVYIDSPGGYLDEARTIMREIAEHRASKKNAFVMECASAATLITLPCDKVYIYEGGEVMIHNPVGSATGRPKEIISYGEGLQKLADSIAGMYAERMGKTVEDVQAMMDAETWMTPQEAVECGFAHEVIPIVAGSGVTMLAQRSETQSAAMDRLFGYGKRPKREKVCHMEKTRISAFFTGSDVPENGPASDDGKRKEDEKMPKTMEELKSSFPELYDQIIDEGRRMERERIKALDDIATDDCAQMIHDAKYGDNPRSAEQVAVEILMTSRGRATRDQKQRAPGEEYMDKRRAETNGMRDVRGGSSVDNDPGAHDEDEIKAFAKMSSEYISRM